MVMPVGVIGGEGECSWLPLVKKGELCQIEGWG